jgi:hypothetical protein
MVTIHRALGLRVVVFIDDHEPAHVHVFGDGEAKIDFGDGEAKIDLSGDEPRLVWAVGMKRSEVRRAIALAKEHHQDFTARWRQIHG